MPQPSPNEPLVVGGRILIDTGSSGEFGWSTLESFLRCPTLHAYQHILFPESKGQMPPAEPLVRGSLMHVGLAHHYQRVQAAAESREPNLWWEPIPAMEQAATRIEPEATRTIALATLGECVEVVESYIKAHAAERLKVVAVEYLARATVMDASGRSTPWSARIDLIVEDLAGKFWLYDHKTSRELSEAGGIARYSLSGQFLAFHHLGRAMFGSKFGGVRVNVLTMNSRRFFRFSPEPTPWALALFPEVVIDARERLGHLKATRDPWHWPRAFSEQVCNTTYGKCPGYELCRWGPSL